MEFLKLEQLSLNPAGYLVSTETSKPVTHLTFVHQQQEAEYIVKLADAIKDKNFECKVDNLEAIKKQVRDEMASGNTRSYVDAPVKPISQVNEELVKFALDFASYEDVKVQNKKINEFMNRFNSINDVETVGDYFSEGIVKLRKLYNTQEILDAVKIHVTKLK